MLESDGRTGGYIRRTSANVMELLQSCTKPSICISRVYVGGKLSEDVTLAKVFLSTDFLPNSVLLAKFP